MIVVNYFI